MALVLRVRVCKMRGNMSLVGCNIRSVNSN